MLLLRTHAVRSVRFDLDGFVLKNPKTRMFRKRKRTYVRTVSVVHYLARGPFSFFFLFIKFKLLEPPKISNPSETKRPCVRTGRVGRSKTDVKSNHVVVSPREKKEKKINNKNSLPWPGGYTSRCVIINIHARARARVCCCTTPRSPVRRVLIT